MGEIEGKRKKVGNLKTDPRKERKWRRGKGGKKQELGERN